MAYTPNPRSQQPLRDNVAAMVFVRTSHLCQSLTNDELDALFEAGVVEAYELGEPMLVEGHGPSGLIMLLDGLVSLTKRDCDVTLDLGLVERPSILGVRASMTNQADGYGAIAHTDAHLVRFPPQVTQQIANSNQRFGRLLAGLMAARTKETERRLAVQRTLRVQAAS